MRPLAPAAVVLLVLVAVAVALESPLSSGATFPDLAGKSLSGSDVTVGPRDGLAKVLVMSFTREAARPAEAWLDACRADETARRAEAPVACYDVRMVQGIPRPIRGFLEGRMRKGMRTEDLARVVLVYKDKEAWRDRMMVMSDIENEAFVVLVDRQGRVQSLLRGPFNAASLKAEQAKLTAN